VATWTIGAVNVTRVEEQIGFASFPPEQYLAGFERELLQRHLPWLVPHHYSPEHDRLVTSVHSWLIRTDRHTILLDSCGGNHKERPGLARFHQRDTPYLARLREAGAAPEDIDIVLCTHLHADHVTGLGALRDRTHCITVMGEHTQADVVSMRVAEGDYVGIEGVRLDVLYTPGHTDDSYSFLMGDRVFTGDTLLIHGTGRTDFQNGSARAQYDSIFGKLLKLPNDTLVYPAHDYNQRHVSSVGQELARNPRLGGGKAVDEFVAIMAALNLPRPKKMDVAVPANRACGEVSEALPRAD